MVITSLTREELLREAFAVRQKHFPNEISFYAPGLKSYSIPEFEQKTPEAFLPISLTGKACALDCDHCDAKILEPMLPLDRREGLFQMCKRLKERGTESVLISGGSKKNGQVPFMLHIDDIARVKEELGMKIIMHTGLVDEEMARGLAEAGVDGVALDIIGDDDTIRDVYHLEGITTADFDKTLALLAKYELSTRPHIIIGLHYGQLRGEEYALEMIARYPTHALILVVFMPLHDTPMQNTAPPPPDEVGAFFAKSRLAMPDTTIMVGCARPGGEHKKIVDRYAVDSGLNGMAYPAEGIIAYARERGLQPMFFENSCSCGCS